MEKMLKNAVFKNTEDIYMLVYYKNLSNKKKPTKFTFKEKTLYNLPFIHATKLRE